MLVRAMALWITLVLLVVQGFPPVAGNWMYLGMSGVSIRAPPEEATLSDHSATGTFCTTVPGLVTQQLQVCESHPRVIQAVSEGARRGIHECQSQFKYERWNCTTMPDSNVFGYTLERGSRETAFIYAVTTAGVVHAVTQACSSGNLTECSCDNSRQGQNTPEGWKWGGCSDNIRYGVQFSKEFVDAPERIKHQKSRNIRNMMNLHNNEAGRQAVQLLMRMQCRCHGVSGSCELKTCWRTIPTFNDVGDLLKKKYETAVQVSNKARKKLQWKDKVKRKVPLSKEDLVHIHKSPNYCLQDPAKGILGTAGRACNRSANGPESCDLLCCGRGYNTQVKRQVEHCHCKFIWCCYVKCKRCESMLDVYTCK